MTERPRRWSDQAIENVVGVVLRTGVILAGVTVLIGIAPYLAQHGGDRAPFGHFHGEPSYLRSIPEIVRGAAQVDWRAVTQLGVVFLLMTPFVRVAVCLIGFAGQRDRLYVIVTSIVMAVLLWSLW